MASRSLEVGIGVDFGMTGSAVAWKTADQPKSINIIRQWPACAEQATKVPTIIKTAPSGTMSWGFECIENDPGTIELFKTLLDPQVFFSPDRTPFGQQIPHDMNKVRKLTFSYLRSLIEHVMIVIDGNLQKQLETVDQLQLHFNFTTPTTWEANTKTIFGNIATNAIDVAFQNSAIRGYTLCSKSLHYDITEAEAAAAFYLQIQAHPFTEGDTFLLLDVGGGTSDLCFLQVKRVLGHWICSPLAPIRGLSKGCKDVLQIHECTISNRLDMANIIGSARFVPLMCQDLETQILAWDPDFQNPDRPISVAIPTCSQGFNHERAGICAGMMIYTGHPVPGSFDHLIKKLVLEVLQSFPQSPKFIVLAGGGARRNYTSFALGDLAPVIQMPNPEAVAAGCLLNWNTQISLMTVIVDDIPVRKFRVGMSQRETGQEVLKHTWRKKAVGETVTLFCMISFELAMEQRWQRWGVTVKTADFPSLLCNNSERSQDHMIEIHISLRLPRVSPHVSDEDFKVTTANDVKVPCLARMEWRHLGEIYPTSP